VAEPAAPGALVLLGGAEWTPGVTVDAGLVERSGGEIVVMPTAAAYENPRRAIETASAWFESLGCRVRACTVLSRADAEDDGYVAIVRDARVVYLSGGSPLHLRSVLKGSPVLHALLQAWHDGAVVAGSSAGAMVLSDPMVDPRGGALTVGLGLVRDVAVVPHYSGVPDAQLRRTLGLAHASCAVVAIAERTALVREGDGVWRVDGPGPVGVFVEASEVGLTALAGRPIG